MHSRGTIGLGASLLISTAAALPYVEPNLDGQRVPEPKLTKSKLNFPLPNLHTESILNATWGTKGPDPQTSYSLVSTYNSGNWMNEFTVQSVSSPFPLPRLVCSND